MKSAGTMAVPAPDAPRADYDAFFEQRLGFIIRLAQSVARSRRMSSTEVPDFVSNVLVHLMEHDYSVLRQFGRRSSLRTYLTTVIRRQYLDARVAQWGKWRPSAGSRRAGEPIVLLERLATRDGMTFDQACAVLRVNHRIDVEAEVLQAHHAGFKARLRPYFVPDTCITAEPADVTGADWRIADRDAYRLLAVANTRLTAALARLPEEERAVLVLFFRDGVTVAATARRLGIDQKQLYRRFNRALSDLRRTLEAGGLDKGQVLGAVGRPFIGPLDSFTRAATVPPPLPN